MPRASSKNGAGSRSAPDHETTQPDIILNNGSIPVVDPGVETRADPSRQLADSPSPVEMVRREIARITGGEVPAPPEGMIGVTMFDFPGSEDGSLTVLLSKERTQLAPAQSLVRIES